MAAKTPTENIQFFYFDRWIKECIEASKAASMSGCKLHRKTPERIKFAKLTLLRPSSTIMAEWGRFPVSYFTFILTTTQNQILQTRLHKDANKIENNNKLWQKIMKQRSPRYDVRLPNMT